MLNEYLLLNRKNTKLRKCKRFKDYRIPTLCRQLYLAEIQVM